MANNTKKTPEKKVEETKTPEAANEQVNPQIQAALDEIRSMKEALEAQAKAQSEREQKLDEREGAILQALKEAKEASAKEIELVAKTHQSKADRMKEHLAKQPLIRIYVPLEGKEPAGSTLPVTMNGYRVNVPKGGYVDVPKQIADIIVDSLEQTQKAGEAFRIDLRQGVVKDGERLSEALS